MTQDNSPLADTAGKMSNKDTGGLTLRDWFAGMALLFFLSGSDHCCACSTDKGDMISVEPKAFDWADVKPGMAFKIKVHISDRAGNIIWYLAKYPYGDQWAIFWTRANSRGLPFSHPVIYLKEDLLRVRDHDIGVQS